MISKNAIIGKKAQLGINVRIGNFTTIEDDVVIGDNTWIGNNVNILDGARIGKNCQIFHNSALSGIPQDLKYEGEYTTAEIGDHTVIREFVTVNKGTKSKGKTIIGNNNLLMANTHIGHDCSIGDHCIIGFSVGMSGEVTVGDWVNISGLTGIHQFSNIGNHCMVGGLSKIVKDIPPYIIAAREPLKYQGINIVGLKRRGFDSEKIDELKEIYRIIFQQNKNTRIALDYIRNNFKQTAERDEILCFVEKSTRGIIKGSYSRSNSSIIY